MGCMCCKMGTYKLEAKANGETVQWTHCCVNVKVRSVEPGCCACCGCCGKDKRETAMLVVTDKGLHMYGCCGCCGESLRVSWCEVSNFIWERRTEKQEDGTKKRYWVFSMRYQQEGGELMALEMNNPDRDDVDDIQEAWEENRTAVIPKEIIPTDKGENKVEVKQFAMRDVTPSEATEVKSPPSPKADLPKDSPKSKK